MPLTLMYITNRPDIAHIAESAGVERIFIDMEYIGKSLRQGGMDTVQSHHTIEDIRRVRAALHNAQLLVRVNPIHDAAATHGSSEEEIDAALAAGADILMLPYFKTVEEVRRFIRAVGGRATTMLLLETAEAAAALDDILDVPDIDEVHIGLNDLSLSYGLPFMFQLLADGTVEQLCTTLRRRGIRYGFGGIAALGKGTLPAELIIREHYRLGSTCAILSRSFCNTSHLTTPGNAAPAELAALRATFTDGIRAIREFETTCTPEHCDFAANLQALKDTVCTIIRPATQA